MKFNIGDLVKVVKNTSSGFEKGTLATIEPNSTRSSYCLASLGDSSNYMFHCEGDLELVERHDGVRRGGFHANVVGSQTKPLVGDIPADVLLQIGQVFVNGAEKYERNSWKKEPIPIEDHMQSALRHIYKFQLGEELDDESGLPNLAHALWRLLVIQHFVNEGKKNGGNI